MTAPTLTILVTIWIMFEGYKIINGQSREPFTVFMWKVLKVVLIIAVVNRIMSDSRAVMDLFDTAKSVVTTTILKGLNSEDSSSDLSGVKPEDVVTSALVLAQTLMNIFASMQSVGGEGTDPSKFVLLGGAGVGTPAVVGGALLLLNKAAMALCLLMSPIFILCLMFNSTKQMFQTWLKFTLGTILSLVILSAMVTICLKGVIYYATAVLTEYASMGVIDHVTGASSGSPPLAQTALLQSGLGLLMSTLIVTVPPMASQMLGGMLGNFTPFTPFSGGGPVSSNGTPLGGGQGNNYGDKNLGGDRSYSDNTPSSTQYSSTSQALNHYQPSTQNTAMARNEIKAAGGVAPSSTVRVG